MNVFKQRALLTIAIAILVLMIIGTVIVLGLLRRESQTVTKEEAEPVQELTEAPISEVPSDQPQPTEKLPTSPTSGPEILDHPINSAY